MTERTAPHPWPGMGQIIREARERLGVTQGELAQMVGTYNKQMVSRWERDINVPSDAFLARLDDVLGTQLPRPIRNSKGRRASGTSTCRECGKEFAVFYNARFCSTECANKAKSRLPSYNWKGGRWVNRHGYVMVYSPEHPNATKRGYMLEHRLVMEQVVGRPLRRHETVHHKNGDRADNRPENLELWGTKHKPGVRMADMVDEIMRQPEIATLDTETRSQVRIAVMRTLS